MAANTKATGQLFCLNKLFQLRKYDEEIVATLNSIKLIDNSQTLWSYSEGLQESNLWQGQQMAGAPLGIRQKPSPHPSHVMHMHIST